MRKIYSIVEGDGEVEAVPKLISKVLRKMDRHDIVPGVASSANGCDNLKKRPFLERLLRFAEGDNQAVGVLVVVDADDNCPKELAAELSKIIDGISVRISVAVVVANREYEAWFLASLPTIAGQSFGIRPGIVADSQFVGDIESRRGVKEWINSQMPKGAKYRETADQVWMTQKIDVDLAVQNSRSFRRLVHAVELLVDAADTSAATISP